MIPSLMLTSGFIILVAYVRPTALPATMTFRAAHATIVYDLNVADLHTFQVAVDGQDLTVHNATNCPLIGKGAWRHTHDRHMSSMPRWAHKSKFTTMNKNKVDKLIRRTIAHGTLVRTERDRIEYTLDHRKVVGTHRSYGTTTRVTVRVKNGRVKTAFPCHR